MGLTLRTTANFARSNLQMIRTSSLLKKHSRYLPNRRNHLRERKSFERLANIRKPRSQSYFTNQNQDTFSKKGSEGFSFLKVQILKNLLLKRRSRSSPKIKKEVTEATPHLLALRRPTGRSSR